MSHPSFRRFPRLAVVATAAVATMVSLNGCQGSPSAVAPPGTASSSTASSSTASPDIATTTVTSPPITPPTTGAPATTTTTRPVTTTTAPPATTPPPAATSGALQSGSSGPAVAQLQQSLTTLGYWLGTPDGKFGTTTQQAVWALQKAAGLPRSGVVDAATAAALGAGTRPTAQSTSGHVIEVDLTRNLLLFVTDGHVDDVLNTSTGGGYVYYDQGSRNVAITPKGHFTTYRVIDGQHKSSLGLLFRPRYFVSGFAIHGDSYVPARPVSHGCVRITDQAINWVWATNIDPIGTPVWVY